MTKQTWIILFLFVFTIATLAGPLAAQERPLPRFVSVRAGEVNMRTGPGTRYPINWVLVRRGQPVEVIAEYESWRQIREWEGDIGWVHSSMLMSKQTVIFTQDDVLRHAPRRDAVPTARAERGVVAERLKCRGHWCRIEIDGFKGWVELSAIWGAQHTDRAAIAVENPGVGAVPLPPISPLAAPQ